MTDTSRPRRLIEIRIGGFFLAMSEKSVMPYFAAAAFVSIGWKYSHAWARAMIRTESIFFLNGFTAFRAKFISPVDASASATFFLSIREILAIPPPDV